MERFHELVAYYERLHEEHEFSKSKVATNVFYGNALKRFDEAFKDVRTPRIKAELATLRRKAEQLAAFSQRETLHDLAERMVGRLNELGLKLYAIPDVEFVLETTRDLELSVLVTCCPEFTHEHACDENGNEESLCCHGTVKRLVFRPGDDVQAATRLYHEKYCRGCEKLDRVTGHVHGSGTEPA